MKRAEFIEQTASRLIVRHDYTDPYSEARALAAHMEAQGYRFEPRDLELSELVELATNLRALLAEAYADEVCDHGVGLCVCGVTQCLEEAERLLGAPSRS